MAEVSVGTHIGRKNLSSYRRIKQNGVELLVAQNLAEHLETLHLDLKRFLFLRSLKAEVEFANGLVLA